MSSFVNLAPANLFIVSSGGMRKRCGNKIRFRPVSMQRNSARVLPLKLVPVFGHRKKAMFRLVSVPSERGLTFVGLIIEVAGIVLNLTLV